MELREAARLLDVSEVTLRRWIRQGLLRTTSSDGQRIDREELLAWARERGLSLGRFAPAASAPPDDLLAQAVARGAVRSAAQAESAAGAFTLAIDALSELAAERRAELRAEVLARERLASTGLGRGVAIPHPRRVPAHLLREPLVSVLFLETPVDWAALDGEPVHTVILLLSPSTPTHLEILARVAFALRVPELPAFLRERPTQAELVERLRSIRKSA
jgi:PTS system nitrogen regulatory IIA component